MLVPQLWLTPMSWDHGVGDLLGLRADLHSSPPNCHIQTLKWGPNTTPPFHARKCRIQTGSNNGTKGGGHGEGPQGDHREGEPYCRHPQHLPLFPKWLLAAPHTHTLTATPARLVSCASAASLSSRARRQTDTQTCPDMSAWAQLPHMPEARATQADTHSSPPHSCPWLSPAARTLCPAPEPGCQDLGKTAGGTERRAGAADGANTDPLDGSGH